MQKHNVVATLFIFFICVAFASQMDHPLPENAGGMYSTTKNEQSSLQEDKFLCENFSNNVCLDDDAEVCSIHDDQAINQAYMCKSSAEDCVTECNICTDICLESCF